MRQMSAFSYSRRRADGTIDEPSASYGQLGLAQVRVLMVIRLLLVAATALATASCGTNNPLSDAETPAYTESAPPVDEPVEYVLYTHCGVESARIGDRWWHAVEPLYGEDGQGTPPEGWGDPYQAGELTLGSEGSATFEAEGDKVDFVPAKDNRPVRMCR
jgi:hypothetical protein